MEGYKLVGNGPGTYRVTIYPRVRLTIRVKEIDLEVDVEINGQT